MESKYGLTAWADRWATSRCFILITNSPLTMTIIHDGLYLFINFTEIKNRLLRNTKRIQNGYFSLKRTKKWFSRLPVGLTLEQTTNADVAGKRIGISAITNSISACQRWVQSHHIR